MSKEASTQGSLRRTYSIATHDLRLIMGVELPICCRTRVFGNRLGNADLWATRNRSPGIRQSVAQIDAIPTHEAGNKLTGKPEFELL